ncbi:MAG: diphthine synthase [Candidatus Micrarchaeota archaeon]|nr:diphthine synthase [Candidatus Micrarchaeota archaeon]MDE1834833.1 diphthine synthase [Candidatus Micrarchaeota archaeon]MDE1859513.1 diphthine synthase [Candidatus Micrarchaeota archaeon]
MLALIGIGLDTKDISLKSLDFIKSADLVICDSYTSIINNEAIPFISEYTKKEITRAGRKTFEDDLKSTITPAKEKDMAILVIGDPLIATTHHIILDEARKQGIKTKVFHSSSVFCAAIGESGLDIYKFGPTTTIPYWSKNYKPTSFLDAVSRNLESGQHTLLLLDINQEAHTPMTIEEASDILTKAMQAAKSSINNGTKVLAIGDIGTNNQSILYTTISKLHSSAARLSGKAICLIIPGKTSFAEDEALATFDKI